MEYAPDRNEVARMFLSHIGLAALLATGLATFAASSALAATDQPDVARLSLLRGTVEVRRADSGDTVLATINAPVSVGDYVETRDDARAEVQFGFATALRVAAATHLRFAALDDEHHRVQVAAGTVELKIVQTLRAHPEIETPRATVRPTESGRYRVTVAGDGATTVTVRSGRADVVLDTGTRHVDAGAALFIGGAAGDAEVRTVVAAGNDDFDRWNDGRDRVLARANDAFLDDGMVGSGDLDAYGRWIQDPRYGRVWSPYEGRSWAPYHDGRFVWEPYYGWTWVAAEPWGWAPYHYGNWFYAAGPGWCWYPGAYALAQPSVYRPAVVAFFSFGGGGGTSFGFGNIGWVPLAPYETFAPWYGRYGGTTVVNNITNVTNVTVVNPAPAPPAYRGNVFTIYHNSTAPGGAVAVERRAFANGNFAKATSVAPAILVKAMPVRGIVPIVPIVPTADNLRYAPHPGAVPAKPVVGEHFARFSPPQAEPHPFPLQQGEMRAGAVAAPPAAIVAPRVVPRPPVERTDVTRSIVGGEHPVEIVSPVSPVSPWDRFGRHPVSAAPKTIRDRAAGSGPEPTTLAVPRAQQLNASPAATAHEQPHAAMRTDSARTQRAANAPEQAAATRSTSANAGEGSLSNKPSPRQL
jgi:hypothetical protein